MTKSLAERSSKTSAIKIIGAVGADPEAHRGEMIKVTYFKIFFILIFLQLSPRI